VSGLRLATGELGWIRPAASRDPPSRFRQLFAAW